MVRCKMQLVAIKSFAWGGKELTFQPNYDPTIPEDVRFQKASPSGQFNITVDNPAALEQFKMGEFYYFDATPVPVPQTAALA